MRPGSIIDDLAEAEPGYLAKQNKELRRLLVECRKELYEVQHSAFGWRSCNVPRQEMTRKGGGVWGTNSGRKNCMPCFVG